MVINREQVKVHIEEKRSCVLRVYLKLLDRGQVTPVDVKQLVIYHSVEELEVYFRLLFDFLEHP